MSAAGAAAATVPAATVTPQTAAVRPHPDEFGSAACRPADILDFERSGRQNVAASVAAALPDDGDIDILTLLRSDAKHSKDEAERAQRQARMEAEQLLASVCLDKQMRDDAVKVTQRRQSQAEMDDDESYL